MRRLLSRVCVVALLAGCSSSGTNATTGTTASSTSAGTASSGTGSTGGTGTTSSGGSSGGTSTGGADGGSCSSADYFAAEYADCSSTACACGLTCVADTTSDAKDFGNTAGTHFCEISCSASSPCESVVDSCVNGLCVPNDCGAARAYTQCDATTPGSQDGWCLPYDQPPLVELYLCTFAGTVPPGGACDGPPERNSAHLCQLDSECLSSDDGGAGYINQCAQACDPSLTNKDAGCTDPNSTCTTLGTPATDFGFCMFADGGF